MKKIRWGILSTATIAKEDVIPAMQKGAHSEIIAIASREIEKAWQVAERFNISKAYGSYEELLADPEIDAVYIPLPNHLHVPWSIKALAAGKHVLCEKPISLSSNEGQELVNFAKTKPHLKLMEAFMYRIHPQWQRAKQLVDKGEIGELRTIQSFFSFYDDSPKNIVNINEFGGGCLLDIGCYNISLSRFIFDAEPKRVCGIVELDANFKVDRLVSGLLDFGKGTSTFTCSTQLANYQRVNIFGAKGKIEIEIPFNAPSDKPTKIWLQDENQCDEIILDICNQYTMQGDLFSLAIINDTEVPTPIQDAVENMKVLEKIIASSEKNCWLAV
jgi:predicted dehydrogenase